MFVEGSSTPNRTEAKHLFRTLQVPSVNFNYEDKEVRWAVANTVASSHSLGIFCWPNGGIGVNLDLVCLAWVSGTQSFAHSFFLSMKRSQASVSCMVFIVLVLKCTNEPST